MSTSVKNYNTMGSIVTATNFIPQNEPSLTGRVYQRYLSGLRVVAGGIPYQIRYNNITKCPCSVEFLLIESSKGAEWIFPKGGWELFENYNEAVTRECIEEAGISGIISEPFASISCNSSSILNINKTNINEHNTLMIWSLININNIYEHYPEVNRNRKWFTLEESCNVVKRDHMKNVLKIIINNKNYELYNSIFNETLWYVNDIYNNYDNIEYLSKHYFYEYIKDYNNNILDLFNKYNNNMNDVALYILNKRIQKINDLPVNSNDNINCHVNINHIINETGGILNNITLKQRHLEEMEKLNHIPFTKQVQSFFTKSSTIVSVVVLTCAVALTLQVNVNLQTM